MKQVSDDSAQDLPGLQPRYRRTRVHPAAPVARDGILSVRPDMNIAEMPWSGRDLSVIHPFGNRLTSADKAGG